MINRMFFDIKFAMIYDFINSGTHFFPIFHICDIILFLICHHIILILCLILFISIKYSHYIMFSILVPMPDGISLSVNIYPPSNFDIDAKYISLVEMTPYRKDDWLTNMGKIYQPFLNNNIMY